MFLFHICHELGSGLYLHVGAEDPLLLGLLVLGADAGTCDKQSSVCEQKSRKCILMDCTEVFYYV